MQKLCSVALVNRLELPLDEWMPALSSREQSEVATYSHPERRARTITSRLLTKYLLARPDSSHFSRLRLGDFAAAYSPEWSSIEILSGTAKARVPVKVCRNGEGLSSYCGSSSHCGPYSAACVSKTRVGLDLERIEPRRQEFYSQSFSAEEQSFVASTEGRAGLSKEAVFTLLWTVKEAFLKASSRHDLSVWTFPRWTVRFDNPAIRALPLDDSFVSVPGAIYSRGFSQNLGVETTRLDNMVLTTVLYHESSPLAVHA